jgi:hypothetical protein
MRRGRPKGVKNKTNHHGGGKRNNCGKLSKAKKNELQQYFAGIGKEVPKSNKKKLLRMIQRQESERTETGTTDGDPGHLEPRLPSLDGNQEAGGDDDVEEPELLDPIQPLIDVESVDRESVDQPDQQV